MIKVGNIIEVCVEKAVYGGDGLCYFGDDKFVVFVENSVVMDKLRVEIVSLNKRFARGKIIEIVKPSPYRIKPFCPLYNACGSCQAQEYDYDFLLEQKRNVLTDIFKNLVDESKIYSVIKSPQTKCYRHKIQYPARQTKNSKRILLGYFKKKSHNLTNIKFCPVQPDIINVIAEYIRKNFPFECYSEETSKGLLKNVLFRINSSLSEISIVFVLNIQKEGFKIFKKSFEKFGLNLADDFKEIKGVFVNFNPKNTNTILSDSTLKVAGCDYILEHLEDKCYKLGATSFFQINPLCAVKVFNIVKENIQKNSNILDAFGGVGAIGIWACDKAKKITLIEQNENAVEMAKENFEINRVSNYEILSGDAKKYFLNFQKEKRIFDCTILDPPRSGCEKEGLESIAKISKKIIYVSCNPQTLKRDIEYLIKENFKVKFIQGVDLFPYTYHIESVCVLERQI